MKPLLLLGCVALGLGGPVVLTAQSVSAVPAYEWSTLSGRSTLGREDGDRLNARFNRPHGLVRDSAGTVYVADSGNHTIRRIPASGVVSTFAGTPGQRGRTDGTGASARFDTPAGLAIDGADNIYVADSGNFTIRKITPAGVVSTVAGSPGQKGMADGPAGTALFSELDQIAADAAGNVYVADHGIRKIAGGSVSTVFTSGTIEDSNGSSNVTAGTAVAVNAAGELFFGATLTSWPTPGAVLVKLDAAGQPSFPIPPQDFGVTADPRVTAIHFIVAGAGDSLSYGMRQRVYYGNEHFIVHRDAEGVTTWYGVNDATKMPDMPLALTTDATGRVLYTRASDSAVMQFLPQPEVFAGTARSGFGVDGTVSSGRFSSIRALVTDSAGNAWVSDEERRRIVENEIVGSATLRKVAPIGIVATTYRKGFESIPPPVRSLGLAIDGSDNVYFGTAWIGPTFMRFAATGTSATLPQTVEIRDAFLLAAAGNTTGRLALMTAQGALRTWDSVTDTYPLLAGSAGGDVFRSARRDGTGADARFATVLDLKSDPSGNYYVLDTTVPSVPDGGDAMIRKITPAGVVTTVSPNLVIPPAAGGARLLPLRLVLDSRGRFFLLYDDATVRLLADPSQPAVIVGGASGQEDNVEGTGTQARFSDPAELAIDAQDNLYVADQSGTVVRKGKYLGVAPVITAQPSSQSAAAGSTVTLSVTATGEPEPTYQWLKDGAAVAGATAASLTISNLGAANTGSYTVVVSSGFASVTSNAATVSLSTPSGGGGGSGGGSGGGGAPSAWFLGLLVALAAIRRWSVTHH